MNYFVISEIHDSKVSSLSKASSTALNKAVNFVENEFKIKVKRLELDNFKDIYPMWAAMMRNGKKNATSRPAHLNTTLNATGAY